MGRSGLERGLDAILILAVATMALVVVRREFFSGPPRVMPPPPTYVTEWRTVLGAGHRSGDSVAPVTLVVFEDLQCPSCRALHYTVRTLRERFRQQLSTVYVPFPLPNHPYAYQAARAAECAHSVGRLAPYLDQVYDNQGVLDSISWIVLARHAGISDTAAFGRCARDTLPVPAIEAGLAAGTALKITGTPTILLNGWKIGGTPPEDFLAGLIKDFGRGKLPAWIAASGDQGGP